MLRTRTSDGRRTPPTASAWTRACAGLALASLALGAAACTDKQLNGSPGRAATGGAGGGQPDGGSTDGPAGDAPAADAGAPQKLIILHTNDIHSHLMGFSPERDYTPATTNDDSTHGGIARLATAIGAAKQSAAAAGTPVLLLDAGDFMMGTLFELAAEKAVPELTLMQALGYDATTIGNHELDWTPAGLAAILHAASMNGVTIPIVASNMHFSATDPGDDALQAFAGTGGPIVTKLIKTVGGLKVGFFGLLGADAVQVTPQSAPLTFDPIATAAAAMVKELRETDKVDLVIALSHSGIDHTGAGEDATMAAAVPGIDIIISGHTHDTLAQPAKVTNAMGSTLIVTAGSYTSYLGELAVTVTPSATAGGQATVALDNYTLLSIDDKIPGDTATQAAVDQYITGLDSVLTPQGLSYKKVVAETPASLALPAFAEAPVGDLVADAYRMVTAAVQPSDPPVIAVEANGQLRSGIDKGQTGQVWFEDLFRVLPIGIGPDQNPGYPLVTFYLNAQDIRSGLELGAAMINDEYFLQVSGLKVTYDMTKNVFGRVSSIRLDGASADLDLTNTTTCYKVVTTNYVAGLLGLVQSFTGNLLSVKAKAKDCTTLIDPTMQFVDADPAMTGTQELKHWQALLEYVSMFPDSDTPADGIPNIPASYTTAAGRITATTGQ
jgi:5'-nucleotidase